MAERTRCPSGRVGNCSGELSRQGLSQNSRRLSATFSSLASYETHVGEQDRIRHNGNPWDEGMQFHDYLGRWLFRGISRPRRLRTIGSDPSQVGTRAMTAGEI